MSLSRRKFLSLSLGAATVGGIASAMRFGRDMRAVTRSAWALGSEVTMTVVGLPNDQATRAIDAALAEIELVESVMSLYRADSPLCRLNRDRVLRDPHPYLLDVLAMAEQTSCRTDGAFDITVQPLWELFAASHQRGELPTDEQIAAARSHVAWHAVDVSSAEVRLRAPATAITLNGIAQGFAADRAVAVLREHGVEHALVNSGEVRGLGRKSSGQNWTVGVQHPRELDAFVGVAALDGRSLATSGDYETTFSADFARHHIFDPRTGQSPSEVASVSIVAPTAMQADALSTAAMVLGPDRTRVLIESLPAVDALFVLKDGRALHTQGFPMVQETELG